MRKFNDYLSAYIKYTDRSEPPTNFHIWTCLSIISAALQRKVYLPWGYNTLYPNMYIILIGPSGCGKGIAMGIGKKILKEVNGIILCSESVTREALIRDMKEGVVTYIDPTDGQTKYHCSVTVMSNELSVFLGQANIKFLADLTDWFDCHDSWKYRTKHQGTDDLVGLCVNMLGATAPDWLRSIFPAEAFGGGFTSRVVFVVEEGKKIKRPDPTIPPEIMKLQMELVRDLEQISLLAGAMQFPKETMDLYSEWYMKDELPLKDPHFAGYCERRGMHTLKIAMLCSVSRGSDLIIKPEDFLRAQALLESVEGKMPRAFMGLGKARYAEITSEIYQYLARHKNCLKSELLEQFDGDLDEYTLSLVTKTLAARRSISMQYDTNTGDYMYTFIGGGE